MTALAFNQLKQPTLSRNFIADDSLGWTFLTLLLICLPGKNISETSSDGNKKKKFSCESGESCAFKNYPYSVTEVKPLIQKSVPNTAGKNPY